VRIGARKKAWTFVIVYVLLIYSTLSVMRDILNFLKTTLGKGFDVLVYGIFGLFFFSGFGFLLRSSQGAAWVQIKSVACYIVLFGMIGIIAIHLKIPEERIHLVEYGLLSFLVYGALRFDFSGFTLFVLTCVIVSGFGFLDEVIQGILPNRYFGWRDVLLNAAGGLMGVGLIAFVFSKQR
jgi:hypothetical protein